MRIQLTVERNGLPKAAITWPINDGSYTVAGLLEKVNEVIPLESVQGHWGLEDYIVEWEGSELLHFSKIHEVVKDNDHITYEFGSYEQKDLTQSLTCSQNPTTHHYRGTSPAIRRS